MTICKTASMRPCSTLICRTFCTVRLSCAQSWESVEFEESIWNDLRGQCILGGEKFLQWVMPKLKEKSKMHEIPRQERYADRPPLSELLPASFPSKSARNEAIVRAHRDHAYSQTAIAEETGLHYSTVSRIISRGWPFSKYKT
jgi:hypothetical protein